MNPTEYTEQFADLLRTILDSGVQDENDFIALAVTGEQLRRAYQLLEEDNDRVSEILARYDSLLSGESLPVPAGLNRDLQNVLDELKKFAARPVSQRDPDTCEELLMGLDEVFSVAAAAHRAGKLGAGELAEMSARAVSCMQELAPALSVAWDFAERRELLFGPDPDNPGLFAWWEELAGYCSSRALLESAVTLHSSARKAAIVTEVLDRLEEKEASQEQSNGEVAVLRPMPAQTWEPALALAAASGLAVGEDRLLKRISEGMEVSLSRGEEGYFLQLVVSEPGKISGVPLVKLPDGSEVAAEREGPRAWVFVLGQCPPGSLELHLESAGKKLQEKISLDFA